jgi:hypothetical protein
MGGDVNFIAPDGSYIEEYLTELGYSVSKSNPANVNVSDLTENSATVSISHDPLADIFNVYYVVDGEIFVDMGEDIKINLTGLTAGTKYGISATKHTDFGYDVDSEEISLEFVTNGGNANYVFSGKTVSNSGIKLNVQSVGKYENWAGVSTAQEFAWQGELGVSYKDGNNVKIFQTDKSGTILNSISFAARYSLLGTVTADEKHIYVVYARENTGSDTTVKTVFVAKYDFEGNFIAEVGTNGFVSDIYNEGFNGKTPFFGGNCTAEINENVLVVNYARGMYSGHQSNDLFAVDTTSMTEITGAVFYNSHSFNQDIVPRKNGGFLALSHGDGYPRSFSTGVLDGDGKLLNTLDTFNFWVETGALDAYDMTLLNKTYAYLGGIGETSAGAVLVGASAPELTSEAKTSAKQVFVQVFNPMGSATDKNSYVTSGERTGLAGPNGDIPTTDYGVKWLDTGANEENTINKIQMTVWNERIFVFYEKTDGTYYQILNADGSVLVQHTKLTSEYILNEHEKPVVTDNGIQWVYGVAANTLKVYTLSPSGENEGDDVEYTVADLIALKKHILGVADANPIDINEDGLINVIDLNLLKYYLLKKTTT